MFYKEFNKKKKLHKWQNLVQQHSVRFLADTVLQ